MRLSGSPRSAFSSRVPRLAMTAVVAALTLPLAGCFLPNDPIPAGIAMPPAYRAGPRHADAALPSVVWWRGFGSRELTALVEEALTSNFDIAAAVARIVQADANSRIAGAALLPVVDLNGSATRSRASQTTGGGGRRRRFGRARQLTAPRSAPATRSTSGARTAPRSAPPKSSPSPAASIARSSRSPRSSASPIRISWCCRRRIGCASRATTSPPPRASTTWSSSASTSAPRPRSTPRSRKASSTPSALRSRRWSRPCGRTSPRSRC